MMPRLASPELRIIRSMLIREFGPTSPLLDQIASLTFDSRHMTGTGYYLTFSNAKQLPRVDRLNTELSEDLGTILDPPADLVGFTLFVRDGYLSSFEGYTFGDGRWPDNVMEKWLVLDAAEADAPSLYEPRGFSEHRERFTPRDLFSPNRQRSEIFDYTISGAC
jgi:hypothetical protein